jgi:hypothetical protein
VETRSATPVAAELAPLPRFPREVAGELAQDGVQGIAHDEAHWYFISTHRIWKVPLAESLERSPDEGVVPFDGRYLHLGDADYFEGALFVPLEWDRRGGPQAIGALRADLTPIGVQQLGGARFAPWCAIDPRTRRLYTSSFDADRIQIFRVELTAERFALTFERDLVFTAPGAPGTGRVKPFGVVPSVQGGVISEAGRLYLASDHPNTGIVIFDADSGLWLGRVPVKFSPRWGPLTHQEIEGIDLFDAEAARVPGVQGHLHVLLHDELPKRSYGFMHWRLGVPQVRLADGAP